MFLFAVAPGPVINLTNDSLTTTTVTLSWTFGFNGNAEITGVNISYIAIANYGPSDNGAASGSVSTTDGGRTSITIYGLQPLTTYQFTVRVRNTVSDEVGVSSPVSVTADTLPLGECTVHVLRMNYSCACIIDVLSVDMYTVYVHYDVLVYCVVVFREC